MSAAKTGTPAAGDLLRHQLQCLGLAVPVAPETRPCRFSMLNGMRMTAVGTGASFSISADTDGRLIEGVAPERCAAHPRRVAARQGSVMCQIVTTRHGVA